MHIGSNVHVDWTWGSVIVHRRWGCVDRRSNRSKVEGKLTVGLTKARWSDYCEGSAVRWAQRDRSGTKSAFASQWWIGICCSGGLAFASFWCACLDRRLLRNGGLAFGTLANRRLVRFVIGVMWFSLSLAECVLFDAFFLSVALSLFCACEENVWR